MNCYCFLLPTFTYITLLSLQKEGESQVSSHFFVSPTKLTGLSMFFCNTCYLIATRYPCREKISGKERRAWELQHDIKMHIRNIFFMRRRKHLPNADWILLTPLFSCITDSPLGVSEGLRRSPKVSESLLKSLLVSSLSEWVFLNSKQEW